MKKVTQINLGNCIIILDNDAYEKLLAYLNTLRSFFEQKEDGNEIYTDIEHRVAEILLAKLKENKPKASINLEDVNDMIDIVGHPSDLGIDEEETQNNSKKKTFNDYIKTKKLYRSKSNRQLTGVAAGIANYFGIDPIWIRLLFVLSVFFGGIGLITYIVLSIILPEDEYHKYVYKKLYRTNENRLLGGVCSGLAIYFGISVHIVRIIFLIPLIAGLFNIHINFFLSINSFIVILVYSLLWAILPIITRSSDKLKLKGEKINVDSIRSEFVQPSNHIHQVLDSIFKVIVYIIKIISIIIGIILLIALLCLLTLVPIAGYGMHHFLSFIFDDTAYITLIFIGAILIIALPIITVFMWLISKLMNKFVSGYVYLSLIVLWFVILSATMVFGVKTGQPFITREIVKKEYEISTNKQDMYTLVFQESPINDGYIWTFNNSKGIRFYKDSLQISNIYFTIQPTDNKEYSIKTKYVAQGKNTSDAINQANAIPVPFEIREDSIFIKRYSIYDQGKKYRGQYIKCILFIPRDKSVVTLDNVSSFYDLASETTYTSNGFGFIEKSNF